MNGDISYFQTCLANALRSENVQEQVMWLERALETEPDKAGDVLRVAKVLQNLSARTSGKDYIAELEKLVRKKRRKEKRKSP
jgi:hypothetical protein